MYEPDKERQNKRWHQVQLADLLSEAAENNPKLTDGTIVVLSGPNPNEAIQYYRSKKLYKKCILVEKNRDTFLMAKLNFDYSYSEQLLNEDIFNTIKRHSESIRGIDFDFCISLRDELIAKVADAVIRLEQPCVWFRLTTSHRSLTKEELRRKQKVILKGISLFSDYEVIDERSINYRDGGAMNVWQVILRNNQKMEEGTMRTLKEMTAAEKDMARALVGYKYRTGSETYTDEDIQKTMNMSKMSVAALKAHVTMGNDK